MSYDAATLECILAAAEPGTIVIIVPEVKAPKDEEEEDTSFFGDATTQSFVGGLAPTEPALLLPTGNPITSVSLP